MGRVYRGLMGDFMTYYKPVGIGFVISDNEVIVNENAFKKRLYFHYITKKSYIYNIGMSSFTCHIRSRINFYIKRGYRVVFEYNGKKILIIYNK